VSLHHHRTFAHAGLAEIAFGLLVLLTAGVTMLWLATNDTSNWQKTHGRVRAGYLSQSHVNAELYKTKVQLSYEYDVNGSWFTGTWTGFWPKGGSPNAIQSDNLKPLTQPGYPLTVYYAAGDPTVSNLHYTGSTWHVFFGWATVVLVATTVLVGVRKYPHWHRG